MWYVYAMEYYSAIKKEWNNAICSNTNGPKNYHTKWSKSDRKTNIIWYHLRVKSKKKKNDTNEFIYKTEIDSDFENKLMVTKGERWGGGIN